MRVTIDCGVAAMRVELGALGRDAGRITDGVAFVTDAAAPVVEIKVRGVIEAPPHEFTV